MTQSPEAGRELDALDTLVAGRLRVLATIIRTGGKIQTPEVLVAAIELSAAFTAIVREEAEAIRAGEDADAPARATSPG